MHLSQNMWHAFARRSIDSTRRSASTGIATFSSSSEPTPPRPPIVTAASLPTTWHATIITLSQITGLTLPGMIDEPGCVAGSDSSNRPQRGPEPSQRMSLAILVRLTAIVLSRACASTTQSRVDCASKWFGASANFTPVAFESFAHTVLPNFGCALMPVPTAVPPIGMFRASVAHASRARSAE